MQGRSPLHVALVRKYWKYLDLFLDGADVNCGDNNVGLSSSARSAAWHFLTCCWMTNQLDTLHSKHQHHGKGC